MIHILQIIKRYAGNYPLYNEMTRLDPSKYKVTVCYLGGKNDGKNPLEEWAKTYYLEKRSSQLRWYNIFLVKQLIKIIDHEKIQVVNCQLHRSTPLGVIAGLLSKHKPLILSTIHGLGGRSHWVRKFQYRIIDPYIYRIIAISHAVAEDIKKSNPWVSTNKIVSIQNGLLLEPFLANEDRDALRQKLFPDIKAPFWFGTAGRLSPVKDHETLIKAFALVVKKVPDSVLLIAGKGELEKQLFQHVKSLNLQNKVYFLGFRSDIPQILQTLDCFVFPSLREGLPLALLEAMASKLPVIASNVGGVPEVVDEKPLGQLVPPKDVESLAAAMLTMTQLTPLQRELMGENSRRRTLEQFTSDRMIRDYERLYTECENVWFEQRKSLLSK